MTDYLFLHQQIHELQHLLYALREAKSFQEKLSFLNNTPSVDHYLKNNEQIKKFLNGLAPSGEYAVKSILAINQGPIVFNIKKIDEDCFDAFKLLVEQLLEIEKFYQHMGGIIGYHLNMLILIMNRKHPQAPPSKNIKYIHPEGIHLNKELSDAKQAIRWGIENLDKIFEMYPVGGAGDRLNLMDDETKTPLPAALLSFLGRTLLEGLIRDVQAREYLYFKLFKKPLLTPIVLMTSQEKNNHNHILSIFKKCKWFGRPINSFSFFTQPLVPVLTHEGNWSLTAPLRLNLKPSGHGVIWKLAEEQGIFSSLEAKGRHQCVIRQINNPLAGLDDTILALTGLGCSKHKAFGFVSCERILNSSEGVNVVIREKDENGYNYCLTNIEYTDFDMRGIGEKPLKQGSDYSTFPTNTNILFADVQAIRKALRICPIPGQLINMKSNVSFIDSDGNHSFIPGGRLESTMQNIADHMIDHFSHQLKKEELKDTLQTFLVYNARLKTISTTKNSYIKGNSPLSTPELAFYDLLFNHYLLLKECGVKVPVWKKFDEHLSKGPACLFLFHPALGPLHSIIKQKIRKGRLHAHAELQLEIAEIEIVDLELNGSLLIKADSPLGILNEVKLLQYGNESRCRLLNIKIRNRGLNYTNSQEHWKNNLQRLESMQIVLHEGAEFIAEGVTFEGEHYFEIPPFHQLKISGTGTEWTQELLPIEKPTWNWDYSFHTDNQIHLKLVTVDKHDSL